MGAFGDRAVELFTQGYSCAQAVLAACAPALGLSEEVAFRLGAAQGAGLGGLRETCGAVNAMVAVLGLRKGSPAPMDAQTKHALYAEAQRLVADFEATFSTHNCRELLRKASIEKSAASAPEARSAEYYAKRPCAAFVRYCADRVMVDS